MTLTGVGPDLQHRSAVERIGDDLFWSLGIDGALWQLLPDGFTLLGAAIIVGSGLYVLRHEQVHATAEHP